MPLNNFTRPNLPYVNQPLPNDNRFEVITRVLKQPITFDVLEGEVNSIIDKLNKLDIDLNGVVAGAIPGSDNPLNANKLLTTDGGGNLSFVNVTNANIDDGSLSGLKITPSSIGTLELGNGVVTPDKIPNLSLPYTKMNFDDGVMPGDKLFNKSVTQGQLGLLSVGTPELIDANVTLAKMAPNSVGTTQLIDANVTLPKMAPNSVGTTQLIDANVTTTKIADGAITLPKIGANVLTPAASKAQQIAAASNTVYTSPAVQQNHPSAAKFLCCFNGLTTGTNAPIFGYNVTSVTRNSTGQYTINLTVPFANTNYIIVGMCNTVNTSFPFVSIVDPRSATNPSITVQNPSQTLLDTGYVCIIGFGLQ